MKPGAKFDIGSGIIPGDVDSIPDPVPLGERPYDVVLLGVTGFTGRMALEYVLLNYGDTDLKLAVAGRSTKRVKTAVDEAFKSTGINRFDIPVLECDASNTDHLSATVKSTRVVATTAGPFNKIGTKLVEACAYHGTSYSDITGETSWVKGNILRCSKAAEKTGARIVSLCGHDCIPWDLSIAAMNEEMPAGESLVEASFGDEISSAASGGTVATIVNAVEDPAPKPPRVSSGDPMYKAAGAKVKNESPLFANGKGMHFLMSSVNAEAVKRVAKSKFTYEEYLVTPDFKTSVSNALTFWAGIMALLTPPLRPVLLSRGLIPKQGSGLSLKAQERGYLRVTGTGRGDKGTVVKTCMYMDVDPGYRDTSRLLMESALCLLYDVDRMEEGGGVWTPGSVMAKPLMERLTTSGTCFALKKE